MRNGYRESFSSFQYTSCNLWGEAWNKSDEYLSMSTVDLINKEVLERETMDTIKPHQSSPCSRKMHAKLTMSFQLPLSLLGCFG